MKPPERPPSMNRAQFLRLAAGATALALASPLRAQHAASDTAQSATVTMPSRVIPQSGERLPIIGLGTWQGFDTGAGNATYARLPLVLQALFDAGGSVIDSSPMYGRAEAVTGELLAAAGTRKRAFVATKVWTRGRAEGLLQIENSLRLLQSSQIDLMQIHNLLDWRNHLPTLRDLKDRGRIRYLGITHYTAGAYDELEAVMRAEPFDFLQINYSLDEREAERRILPLAAERGMAVLINRPFGGGGLLRRLRDRPLPRWAGEIGASSWAQLLLKFVLSQTAVTCAIPGTSRPEHMIDNAGAGSGPIPAPAYWKQHPEIFDV